MPYLSYSLSCVQKAHQQSHSKQESRLLAHKNTHNHYLFFMSFIWKKTSREYPSSAGHTSPIPIIQSLCLDAHIVHWICTRVSPTAFSAKVFAHYHPHASNNRLKLPRIAQRILNHLVARDENILAHIVILLLGEVYPAILDHPARFLCKVDNTAFRVEEEEGLGVRDGDGWVCALAARRDFLADGADEDLEKDRLVTIHLN